MRHKNMKKLITFCLLAVTSVLTLSAQSIYDFKVKDDVGQEVSLSDYKGTIQEIHQFCSANFDIQFPQFDKIEVNGVNEHPLYTWLKAGKDIKWNFTKFLVSRDGRVLKRYEPTDQMANIEADICMEVN